LHGGSEPESEIHHVAGIAGFVGDTAGNFFRRANRQRRAKQLRILRPVKVAGEFLSAAVISMRTL